MISLILVIWAIAFTMGCIYYRHEAYLAQRSAKWSMEETRQATNRLWSCESAMTQLKDELAKSQAELKKSRAELEKTTKMLNSDDNDAYRESITRGVVEDMIDLIDETHSDMKDSVDSLVAEFDFTMKSINGYLLNLKNHAQKLASKLPEEKW